MLGLVAARTGMGQVQAIVLAHGIGQIGLKSQFVKKVAD